VARCRWQGGTGTAVTLTHADIPRFYVEDDNGDPYPVRNLDAWVEYQRSDQRVVAFSSLLPDPDQDDTTHVSTVFVGINQELGRTPPLLYETAVFRGTAIVDLVHSESRDAAQDTHDQIVESLTALQ
jgi:hypothetical protein